MSKIPSETIRVINGYVLRGQDPGGFVRYVLANDLREAIIHADPDNLAAIVEIVKYVYHAVPAACYGSDALMKSWMRQGGAEGILFKTGEVFDLSGLLQR
ncbi:MAG: hypothetical protein PHI12_10985 [Dehalococcoidales bacterium]|nr:hypothetical protein [Dehalococcoidales bacterium]